MSRTNQKNSTKLEDILVPRQFSLRLWDTWEAPSLILLLDGKDKRILRETFDIHWEDLDIHIRLVDECNGTGVAFDQRPRREKNVKVVYQLNRVPEGIKVEVHIVAMTVGVEKPLLDEHGYARKLTYERLFPNDRLQDLFNKANAFVKGMNAFKLSLWALEEGKHEVYGGINNALDFAYGKLNDSEPAGGLTATVKEVSETKAKGAEGTKGQKRGAKKIPVISEETADDRTDAAAQALTAALTGIDPGKGVPEETDETSFADLVTPVPVASASPTPAPAPKADKPAKAPKKDRPKPIKLGSPEAATELVKLGATPSDGSNGQTS